jgi:serine/threonine-protein kinase RsbW
MTATMTLTLPGDRHASGHARSMVELWLSRLGVTPCNRDDVSLIIGEACANAAMHARHTGDVQVCVTVAETEVVIDVTNTDGIAEDEPVRAALPDPLAEKGRGLAIISALADAAQIRHEPSRIVVHTTVRRSTTNAASPPPPAGQSPQRRP